MKRRRRIKRPPTAWQKSARFRQIGSEAITAWNLRRGELPKCTATAKHSGDRCGNPAMENGKCYFHGGKTPKGDGWHVTQWPDGDAPDAEIKLSRKLKAKKANAARRARRLASMTDEQRLQDAAWQKAHKPGRAADRARLKKERADAASFAASVDAPHPQVSSEQARLAAELRALRYKVAILEGEGIFG